VKEKLLAETHRQIRLVIEGLSRPENVLGATFLEELPCHFTGTPFYENRTGDTVSWDLARFRKEIEAERGVPLRWDDETRRWWARQYCRVLDEIHAEMKRALDGRLVFYYQQTNHGSLDLAPADAPLDQPMLMPLRWTEIIKPGLCEGFFAFPNNQTIWDGYLQLAKAHDWLFFSQLPHPPYRLCSWDDCLALAKTRVPQNLGYFFYCEGDCAAKRAWNVDRDIPPAPEWNTPGVSLRRHVLRHLAVEKVNLDLLKAQPALRLHLDLPLKEAAAAPWLYARIIVENNREPASYLDPAEAVARDVTVTLVPPPGFVLDPRHAAPATIPVSDLAPGERQLVDWWVTVPRDVAGAVPKPFAFTAKTEGAPPTVLEASEDTLIPGCQPHEFGISGSEWLEAPFRLKAPVQPTLVFEALATAVRRPAVGAGEALVRYDGVLDPGTRLVLTPPGTARLFAQPLLADDGTTRADAQDSSRFKAWDDGYLVINLGVGRAVKGGMPLRVVITGKAADEGQSLAVLRFTAKGEFRDLSLLANGFTAEWGEAAETVTVPADADTLQQLFLYRFKSKGRVWYGPARIERQDVTADGLDVSARLQGSFSTLAPDRFSVFRYVDDELPSLTPRVRVQLQLPPP
jgi:hypothetical protein